MNRWPAGKKLSLNKEEHLSDINQQCRQEVQRLLARIARLRQDPENSGLLPARQEWEQLRQDALQHNFAPGKKEQKSLLERYQAVFETGYYDFANRCLYLNGQMELAPAHLTNSTFGQWKLDNAYRTIAKNTIITSHFEFSGYETGFDASGKYFTPYFYQAILLGAIGEEAVKAILKKEGITFEKVPNALYELADLKLANRPLYIDAKNYSDDTLARFSLGDDHPQQHPKMNDGYFKQQAADKWRQIQQWHRHEKYAPKLVYINVFGHEEWITRGYRVQNGQLQRCQPHLHEADVLVFPNMLGRDSPETLHPDFEYFISELNQVF